MENNIEDFVKNEVLFDTHEHLETLKEVKSTKVTFRDFGHYVNDDLNTAQGINAIDDWQKDDKAYFKYFDLTRNTGYAQSIEFACKEYLSLDFSFENITKINNALDEILESTSPEKLYDDLFCKANINFAIVDRVLSDEIRYKDDYPENVFRVVRIPQWELLWRESIEKFFEKPLNVKINSLDDFLYAIDLDFANRNKNGKVKAVKIATAYQRQLTFVNESKKKAEIIFNDILKNKDVDKIDFMDYIHHYYIKLAEKNNIPVQIHTGHLAGNWNDVRTGNPEYLIPLFQKYKNVNFDIFHAAWPYSEILGSIAKSFPNVYINMCWGWSLNPIQMERMLDEWLSCVPHNKIFAFGGDTQSIFALFGNAIQARKGIANVLKKKVETKEYSIDFAKLVAKRIMNENALNLYQILIEVFV